MGIINKMCCVSIVVFNCNQSFARSILESYTVHDHHFTSGKVEKVNSYQPKKITYDLWALGA